jgi:signal transduction histidine kinase
LGESTLDPLLDRAKRILHANYRDATGLLSDTRRIFHDESCGMLTEKTQLIGVMTDKFPVLVVDDEYGPRESIAFTLSSEFAVDTAERAAEGLAKLKERAYAAVVMDIRMPEMDGIRALEELRKIDPHVSVIMLTGYGTLLTAQQAMLAGANQYLKKPPDVTELLAAVRQQTQNTRLRRHQARLADEAQEMNVRLKQEIEQSEPQIWQARASVELVHDLNNPLTVVIGYAALLAEEARLLAQRDSALAQKLLDYSGMVEKAAEYCHHLSENWRLASKKTGDFARIDIVQVAHEVRQVIFFGNVAIQFTGLSEGYVRGSKYELMRVFQNLFKNSLEAGATRLLVAVTRNNTQLEITVTDNGSGMDAERMKRALHGGFSSKANGTGLGLSICRHLVGTHGATFNVESAPGKGTIVRLVFPAQE